MGTTGTNRHTIGGNIEDYHKNIGTIGNQHMNTGITGHHHMNNMDHKEGALPRNMDMVTEEAHNRETIVRTNEARYRPTITIRC